MAVPKELRRKRNYLMLAMGVLFALVFIVNNALAHDNDNNDDDDLVFIVQDSVQFTGNSYISDQHSVNQEFPIYIFLANNSDDDHDVDNDHDNDNDHDEDNNHDEDNDDDHNERYQMTSVSYNFPITVTLTGTDQYNRPYSVKYNTNFKAHTSYVTVNIKPINTGKWTVSVTGKNSRGRTIPCISEDFYIFSPQGFTIQDTSPDDFIPDGGIQDTHYALTDFNAYVFITDKDHDTDMVVPYDVPINATLIGKDDNNNPVRFSYQTVIKANNPYGALTLNCPFPGDWTLSATGNLKQSNGIFQPFTATVSFEVIQQPQTGLILSITPASATIAVGQTQQFKAYLNISGYLIDVTPWVIWTSRNLQVATVGNLGQGVPGAALGIAPGTTNITVCTLLGLTASANLTVTGSAGLQYELKAYSDSDFKNSIDSTYRAGASFYIKVTAKKADGTLNPSIYYSTQGKQNADVTLFSKDPQGNEQPSGKVVDVAGQPGIGILGPISYDEVNTIQYLCKDTLNPTATSNYFSIRFYPDHLGVVAANGETIGPRLQLRTDYFQTGQTWGYIGGPMQLAVELQAFNAKGNPSKNYVWDTDRFSVSSTWQTILTAASGNPEPSRLSVSPISISSLRDSNGVPTLYAILNLTLQKGSLQEQESVKNINLSINPSDADGVTLLNSANAYVVGGSGPYNLYGGRIRVVDGTFTQPTAKVKILVERFDGGFETHSLDSETLVTKWNFGLNTLDTPLVFRAGEGFVSVTNNESYSTFTLSPASGYYPSYLGVVSGTLTWDRIIEPPPPSQLIYEHELPPTP